MVEVLVRPAVSRLRAPWLLALGALPAPAWASGSTITGEAVLVVCAWLLGVGLQLLVTAVLAIRRARARGRRSALAYVAGSLATIVVAFVLMALVADGGGGAPGSPWFAAYVVFFALCPLACWAVFLVVVRLDDRRERPVD